MTYGGNITVGETLVFNGANLTSNDLATNKIIANGDKLAATLNGGLLNDSFVIDASTATTNTEITVSGDLGLGTDKLTVTGGSGDDKITISALTGVDEVSIDGGKGNDTIKLGAAAETVKFAATAVDNGVDTISGFTAGTGPTADVLDVSALVGTTQTAAFGAANSASALADGTVVSYTNAGTALDAAGVAALFAAAQTPGKYTAGASSDYVFVEQSGNTAKLWVINNDATAAVTAAEVKLVGTVNADAALEIKNFA
jgi:hypothetical protein